MDRLLSALLCVAFISILMEKVESYNAVFEFVHKCNAPMKEIHNEETHMVVYARELLPVNHCRLSFISKAGDVKVCVKTDFFSITDCGIKLNYYKTFGFIDKSYSCNDTSPPEFCVENKEILYISLQNANLYTTANIKLLVTASKPASLLWLIGVAVGVLVFLFILYHACKPRIQDHCKKNKTNIDTQPKAQASSNEPQSGSPNTSNSNTAESEEATATKTYSREEAVATKTSTPNPLTSGNTASQTVKTIPEQPKLPLIPLPPVVPTQSPLAAEVPTPQSHIQVQVSPRPVPSGTDLYPPATSPPPEFEVAIQMDQIENNERHLPTQIEAPEYHTFFVSPPPYTEHPEKS